MPREISQLERKRPNEVEVKQTKDIKAVLNILDHMIAGKRFGEFDSGKQMYLFNCQTKINDMQHGYFTEESLIFLDDIIDALMKTLISAKHDINLHIRSEENESNDKYADESEEKKKLLEKKETK